MNKPYTLYTMDNSPYSDKIRALLRYKRLPVIEHTETMETRFSVLQARTGKTMVPVVITPDDEALNDSTRIAERLDELALEPATRWDDPSLDTLAMVLEDYADEWLVRIMLCSRWYHEADNAQNRAIIACGMTHGVYGMPFQRAARDFPDPIIATIPKMGATPENASSWYAMVPRILAGLAVVTDRSAFLTGSRPHQVDFAFYGQLNQIRRDPTGYEWIEQGPEAVRGWMGRLEQACPAVALNDADAAKDDCAEQAEGQPIQDPSDLEPILREAAQTYYRMAVANSLAVDRGADGVEVELAEAFDFHAAPARYNRKVFAAVLDRLEQLYAGGSALPEAVEATLLKEFAPLARAGSPLLDERAALAERVRALS